MTRQKRRLLRQIGLLERKFPMLREPVRIVLNDRWMLLRLLLSLVLIVGGIFSFLPILGIWMLPLGLLFLAVDIPVIQPAVGAGFVRMRRRLANWSRSRRKP